MFSISMTDSAVDDKEEVLDSLKTHNNLLEIDFEQNLKLKNRHTGVTQLKSIKGYPLSEKTLKIAVPVMNLMIYVNPVFAYLSKPAIAALCINLPSKGKVRLSFFQRFSIQYFYVILYLQN